MHTAAAAEGCVCFRGALAYSTTDGEAGALERLMRPHNRHLFRVARNISATMPRMLYRNAASRPVVR